MDVFEGNDRNAGYSGSNSLRVLADASTGLLRATLLFGSIVIALSLILAPAADREARTRMADGAEFLDPVITGSVKQPGGSHSTYVVMRSVLQTPGAGPCLLFPDGRRKGECWE
ncbi:hypothetical protein [Consotaella aegiceratis]|uniref:hypothetical protein n=1 Tax=Consotaella aegiceratis TaxID=3097961 RepID=UPI002F3FB6C9